MARRNKKGGSKRAVAVTRTANFAPAAQSSMNLREQAGSRRLSRRKLWLFRLLAALGIPLVLFLAVEIVLWLAGAGYPTAFLIHSNEYDRSTLVQNEQFGWRFFGRHLARTPAPLAIAARKPSDTQRVFVFGESAAFGDPQPDYGLPRMLQAMLSVRHPQVQFEVVNAAMIGINSHTIREIAEDCAAAEGDIWLVYMGNNEVVGPFGAGTVFGSQTPPLPVVRSVLALKSTRSGQLLDQVLQSARGAGRMNDNWGGMAMFLENRVALNDPRMQRVYHHYRQNLREIINAGLGCGAEVIVSTVAVNLRDSPPFASDFSRPLTGSQLASWESSFEQGLESYEAGDFAGSIGHLEKAAELDARVANLQYLLGRARLELGELPQARDHLELARDLDLLRFRCDRQMQEITRDVVGELRSPRVRLVDAAKAFDEESSTGVAGEEQFYEHVHLTFAGNYLLARIFAEQIDGFMTDSPGGTTEDWPTIEECAARLAWGDTARHEVLSDMLARLNDAPFTAQLGHAERMQKIAEQLLQSNSVTGLDALRAAARQCEQALESAPTDHVLNSQLALLLGRAGDLDGAHRAALRAATLLPHDGAKWYQLGLVLSQQGRLSEALEAFEAAHKRSPTDASVLHAHAKTLIQLERADDALSVLQQIFRLNSRYGPAYLTAGLIFEEKGDAAAADRMFRRALNNRVLRVPDLAALARVCFSKGWYREAATNFRDALNINPADPTLHSGAGNSLAALGEHEQAEQHFREAIRLAPASAQLRYEFGVYLARREQHAEAAAQFAAAADLNPEFLRARVDCGMALIASGRLKEAQEQFQQVLDHSPQHAVALEYKAAIEKELKQLGSPGK